MRWYLIMAGVVLGWRTPFAFAQFSPGELARAHEKLEGMNHCADCHEVGKEISGVKCLACHTEIKKEVEAQHGYHAAVSSLGCVSCHKDHLGKDAQITLVDRSHFDHSKTGFLLTGKHATIKCDDCHTMKFIKNPDIAKKGRKTSLGLMSACVSCHEDVHHGTVGTECNTCHVTTAWKPAPSFDHSRTKFALVGKHRDIACSKCHTDAPAASQARTVTFATKSFVDCAPCHVSPHTAKFSSQSCMSCHVPAGWNEVRERKFNHDLTSFKLKGKHAVVKCEQCHKPDVKAPGRRVLKMQHEKCTDCHEDHHQGEFLVKYRNNCARCHTEESYKPSTFTLALHEESRFPLKDAHAAIPCAKCHNPSAAERSIYRFAALRCESCHKDRHNGQFKNLMGEANCGKCHTTDGWKSVSFDHSATSFALAGKHVSVSCSGCHKPEGKSTVVLYKGSPTKCESCHADPHAKQFVVQGVTSCSLCHTSSSWTLLLFDHEKQSTFSLTGAHKKVPCRSCHHEERLEGKVVIRFKPLSNKCETCHTEKESKNG